jgi:hypothetical protein
MNASETNIDRGSSRAKRPRSAVTSGRQLFVKGNPNSDWARRFHDLRTGYISDISCGRGRDALTWAQLAIIDRVVALQCECERCDALLSRAEPVDMDVYARVSSHLRRHLETLGVERRMLPINQSPDEYLAQASAEESVLEAEIIEEPAS